MQPLSPIQTAAGPIALSIYPARFQQTDGRAFGLAGPGAAGIHRELRRPERGRPELGTPGALVSNKLCSARATCEPLAEADLFAALPARLVARGLRHLCRHCQGRRSAESEHALCGVQGGGRPAAADLPAAIRFASRNYPSNERLRPAPAAL